MNRHVDNPSQGKKVKVAYELWSVGMFIDYLMTRYQLVSVKLQGVGKIISWPISRWNRNRSVSIVTKFPSNSLPGRGVRVSFPSLPRPPALWHDQSPIQWVPAAIQRSKATRAWSSPLTSNIAVVKNTWNCKSAFHYFFIVWFLITQLIRIHRVLLSWTQGHVYLT